MMINKEFGYFLFWQDSNTAAPINTAEQDDTGVENMLRDLNLFEKVGPILIEQDLMAMELLGELRVSDLRDLGLTMGQAMRVIKGATAALALQAKQASPAAAAKVDVPNEQAAAAKVDVPNTQAAAKVGVPNTQAAAAKVDVPNTQAAAAKVDVPNTQAAAKVEINHDLDTGLVARAQEVSVPVPGPLAKRRKTTKQPGTQYVAKDVKIVKEVLREAAGAEKIENKDKCLRAMEDDLARQCGSKEGQAVADLAHSIRMKHMETYLRREHPGKDDAAFKTLCCDNWAEWGIVRLDTEDNIKRANSGRKVKRGRGKIPARPKKDDKQYEFEGILRHKPDPEDPKQSMYLVQWADCGDKTSWLRREDFSDGLFIDEYHKTHPETHTEDDDEKWTVRASNVWFEVGGSTHTLMMNGNKARLVHDETGDVAITGTYTIDNNRGIEITRSGKEGGLVCVSLRRPQPTATTTAPHQLKRMTARTTRKKMKSGAKLATAYLTLMMAETELLQYHSMRKKLGKHCAETAQAMDNFGTTNDAHATREQQLATDAKAIKSDQIEVADKPAPAKTATASVCDNCAAVHDLRCTQVDVVNCCAGVLKGEDLSCCNKDCAVCLQKTKDKKNMRQVGLNAVCVEHALLVPGTSPVQKPIFASIRDLHPAGRVDECTHDKCKNKATHVSAKVNIGGTGLLTTKFTPYNDKYDVKGDALVAGDIEQEGLGVKVRTLLHPTLAAHFKKEGQSPPLILNFYLWNNCCGVLCHRCYAVLAASKGFLADTTTVNVTPKNAAHFKDTRCSYNGCNNKLDRAHGEVHIVRTMGVRCINEACTECPGDRVPRTATTLRRTNKQGLLSSNGSVPTLFQTIDPDFPTPKCNVGRKEHILWHDFSYSTKHVVTEASARIVNGTLVHDDGQEVDSSSPEDSEETGAAPTKRKRKQDSEETSKRTGKKKRKPYTGSGTGWGK